MRNDWYRDPKVSPHWYPPFCKTGHEFHKESPRLSVEGDVIPWGEYVSVITRVEGGRAYYDTHRKDGAVNRENGSYKDDASWVHIMRPTGVAKRAGADSGLWNSTCKLCGRGLYIGFTTVEHEGGRCA